MESGQRVVLEFSFWGRSVDYGQTQLILQHLVANFGKWEVQGHHRMEIK